MPSRSVRTADRWPRAYGIRPPWCGTCRPRRWSARRASDCRQPGLDLRRVGPGRLLDHLAVPQENEVRPELHAERPAERLAPAVGNFDVLDAGVALQGVAQGRLDRLAVRAPVGP